MTTSDEAIEINLYLVTELANARKYNEVLEARVIELMANLRESSQLLNACRAYMS
jgi:hypothetical protein